MATIKKAPAKKAVAKKAVVTKSQPRKSRSEVVKEIDSVLAALTGEERQLLREVIDRQKDWNDFTKKVESEPLNFSNEGSGCVMDAGASSAKFPGVELKKANPVNDITDILFSYPTVELLEIFSTVHARVADHVYSGANIARENARFAQEQVEQFKKISTQFS